MEKTITTIKKELHLNASQQTCFNVFTKKMDAWWPKTHHVGSAPLVETVLEPKLGGRWYTKHEDGSESMVGHVLTWDPYSLLILNWQIDGNFQCDPELRTEVEIRFISEGPAQTRIEFEHRNLDKLAGGTKIINDMDNGWGMILDMYKNLTENEA
jgi:hypothetical protein